MAQDQQGYRRAANVALGGLVIQIVLSAIVGLTALGSDMPVFNTVALAFLGGIPVWAVIWVVLNQYRLERIESLEAEQINRADSRAASVFTETDEDLLVARRRLNNLVKWVLPGTSLFLATYLLIVGIFGCYTAYRLCLPIITSNPLTTTGDILAAQLNNVYHTELKDGALAIVYVIALFVSFVFARYAAGMAKASEFQLLRGGASYLIGNAILAALLVFGILFAVFENRTPIVYITLLIPFLVALLGGEIIVTQLLSAYRPRKPGETPRPAYDSRLLGMFTSPTSLAKAISDAINYQFGFEVSRSWFYRLLSRAVLPLIIFGILILLGISCLGVVQPHEQGILTVSGAVWNKKPLDPGIHFKPPWPFGTVETYEVGRVFQISVGSSARGLKEGAAILWTNEHTEGKEEYLLCAPTPLPASIQATRTGVSDQQTPGNSLIGGQVVVQYRIADLMKYVTSSVSPPRQIAYVSEAEVNRFFVARDIDSLLGPARINGGSQLQARIQTALDKAGMGVDVIFVGLTGLHPPKDENVAQGFQEQASVLQERQSALETAQRDAIQALAQVAGSPEVAREIVAAIAAYQKNYAALDEFRKQPGVKAEDLRAKEQELVVAEGKIEAMMVSGKSAQILAAAHAYRWQRAIGERAKAERFVAELTSYRQAPELYRSRRYLEVLSEGMMSPRKIIITSQQSAPSVFRLDFKDSPNALGTMFKDLK